MKVLINHCKSGFSYVELVVCILIIGIVVGTLIELLPNGIDIFRLGLRNHKLHFLAKEKMAEIKAQKLWIHDIDTSSPSYPGLTNDLAEQWKSELNADGRNFASTVSGVIQVTHLTAALTPFLPADFTSTTRDQYEISVSVTEGSETATVKSYLTVPAAQQHLLGILYLLKRALQLYNENTAAYPLSGQLNLLIPNYLPYIANDPYTAMAAPVVNNYENEIDYSYTNSGGVRKVYAISHDEIAYPNLVLTW